MLMASGPTPGPGGEQLLLASRPVTIEQLELLRWDPSTGQLEIKLRCSAGTYVRSLARDLGDQLGCGGALAVLRRTAALGFTLEASLPLEALGPETTLSDPLQALEHLPKQRLSQEQWLAWTRGQRLPLETLDQPEREPLGDAAARWQPGGHGPHPKRWVAAAKTGV